MPEEPDDAWEGLTASPRMAEFLESLTELLQIGLDEAEDLPLLQVLASAVQQTPSGIPTDEVFAALVFAVEAHADLRTGTDDAASPRATLKAILRIVEIGAHPDSETAAAWDAAYEMTQFSPLWMSGLRVRRVLVERFRRGDSRPGLIEACTQVLRHLQVERTELDKAEFELVRELRRQRATWSEIAEALGVTQPAAHSRFAHRLRDETS